MENHFNDSHNRIQRNLVLEIVLDIIDLSLTKVDEQIHDKFVNINGGGTEKSNKNEHKVIFELHMFSSGDFEICAKLHLTFVLTFLKDL